MATGVIREVDPAVPVVSVRATRGKYLRAEPVSVLYAQGRVRHVGALPELEDELCDFGPGGLSSGRSPDRMDALVWALTELMLREKREPRVRVLVSERRMRITNCSRAEATVDVHAHLRPGRRDSRRGKKWSHVQ